MVHRKWRNRVWMVCQVFLAVGIAACSIYLLFHYAKYGQQNREAAAEVRGQNSRIQKAEDTKTGKNKSDTEAGEKSAEHSARQIFIPDTIRVRIMDQDFQHEYHASVSVSCSEGYTVSSTDWDTVEASASADGTERQETAGTEEDQSKNVSSHTYSAEEKFTLEAGELEEGELLCVQGENGAALSLESIKRGDGVPWYSGKLYLMGAAEGISVINELPLEEYLYSVVSSEMPSDYPMEALKAQAICARTYAVNCMSRDKNEQSYEDLNDSVSFQVYNNYGCTDQSVAAVEDTAGQILPLREALYYSTSCLSEHREDLDNDVAFAAFLEEEPEDSAQFGSPWLRWSTEVPVQQVIENVKRQYGDPGDGLGLADEDEAGAEATDKFSISIDLRRGDGQVQTITVQCSDRSYVVEGEYQIRKVLGGRQTEITLRNGSVSSGMELLPSAFFYLEEQDGVICIYGGGYGHGNGMSQCGAAEMASKGLDDQEILQYYYGESAVQGNTD